MQNQPTFHLLFTTDFQNAENEIKQLGGHITVVLTKSVFLACFKNDEKIESLKYSSIQQPRDLDAGSTEAAESYMNGMAIQTRMVLNGEAGSEKSKQIKTTVQLPSINIPAPSTSEEMLGDIGCTVFMLDGPTADLQFSQDEKDYIRTCLSTAGSFLSYKSKTTYTKFNYLIQGVGIDSKPIIGPCQDVDVCENLFMVPVLRWAGVIPDYNGIIALCERLIDQQGFDWGFVIFMVKYKLFYPAYTRGAFSCYSFNQIKDAGLDLTEVIIHETCHIFGAADEAANVCNDCSPSGLNKVPNNNCVNCDPKNSNFDHSPCIMLDYSKPELCFWTMGQIGWLNTKAGGNPFLLFNPLTKILNIFYVDASQKLSVIYQNVASDTSIYNNLSYKAGISYLCIKGGVPSAAFDSYFTNTYVAFTYTNNGIILVQYDFTNISYKNLHGEVPLARDAHSDPSILIDKGKIYVMYRDDRPGISAIQQDDFGNWKYIDMTYQSNFARANSSTFIVKYAHSDRLFVFYVGIDENLCAFVWDNNPVDGWYPIFVGANIKAPKVNAFYGRISAEERADNKLHVVYTDVNYHISHIIYDGHNWSHEDIIAASGAQDAMSEPSIVKSAEPLNVAYTDVHGRTINLWYFLEVWNCDVVSNNFVQGQGNALPVKGICVLNEYRHFIFRREDLTITDIYHRPGGGSTMFTKEYNI